MQNDNQLNNKDPLIKQLEATNAKLAEINSKHAESILDCSDIRATVFWLDALYVIF